MPRLHIGRLAIALFAGLGLAHLPSASWAQTPEPQKISFETVDKVMLRGTWYPSSKDGSKSPVVILVHKLGADRMMPGFESLAQALQAKGFAVLSFDMRGHGDSTGVREEFWKYQCNSARTIKGGGPKKDTIEFKEFTPSYYPHLVNDIAAAKLAVEMKNNAKECNAGDTIVIGVEDGATLAAMWVATEWQRRRTIPNPMMGGFPTQGEPEGRDIAAAIYLSLRPSLGSGNSMLRVAGTTVANWFYKDQKVRDKVGMLFLYGDGDAGGAQFAKYIFDDVMRADKLKNKLLFKTPIKETKLVGAELLKKGLPTEEWIVKYVGDKVMETRASAVWAERDLKSSPPIMIPVNQFGFQ